MAEGDPDVAKEQCQKSRIVSGARSDFICPADGAAIPAGERRDDAGGASMVGSGYECATRGFSHSRMIRIDGLVDKGRSVSRHRSL